MDLRECKHSLTAGQHDASPSSYKDIKKYSENKLVLLLKCPYISATQVTD